MRAKSYVSTQDAMKSGSLSNGPSLYERGLMGDLSVFDKEIRRVAAVAPDAYVMSGDKGDRTSWFFADMNVRSRYLVLSYDRWEDGQFYWNLQENTDVDGPEGVVDLKRSKVFGVVLRYLTNLVNAA